MPDGPSYEIHLAEHLAFLHTLKLPAFALSASSDATLSHIGGLPLLPESMAWPNWNGEPLAFLCQLNLSEIPHAGDRQSLLDTGMLFFFYCQEQETWGFDPKDAGSWRVIYAPSPSDTPREKPEDLYEEAVYQAKHVCFTAIETFPDWQDERVDSLDFDDQQSDAYHELCTSVFPGQEKHQLFGYPATVQGNHMELECQLVSNGLYCGDGTGYKDPRAKDLEPGKEDWILLLQLDSDDSTGMMWGDCGTLYFWIRKQDLASGSFDKCWMVLQCG